VTRIPIRRALVSVYDKAGLAELAKALHEAGTEIVSTGTTARTIEQAGIPVTKVEELTGFPECLDGRVKTLHPRVHAGLLADTMNPDHNQQLMDLGIAPFQLLVSNLYPFEQTVASGADDSEIIEQIDIGGPAMVRAAAKNHGSVAVVTSPAQYSDVVTALADGGQVQMPLAETFFASRFGMVADKFGVDTYVRATSDRWVSQLAREDRPDIVIEAVGHQVATLNHAIEATGHGGTVFYFGVADDDSYPISMRTMLRNNLTLKSGVTLDRRRMLDAAGKFAAEHPGLLATYLTHTFGIDQVQAAFELACRPEPGRVKIAITESGAA